MIRLQQLKLAVPHEPEALKDKIIKTLRVRESDLISFTIRKHSLDARKKPALYDVYTVDAEVLRETQVLKKNRNKNITAIEKEPVYTCIPSGTEELSYRPVVIGTGPAGLFCGYQLARMGYCPVLLERGEDVDRRVGDVEEFWEKGTLRTESNVQFGEGGAGTFSDGKLNTMTHDRCGRNQEVLRIFAEYGAPDNILYESKPHIGTDILVQVVKNIRKAICKMGGEVRFHTKVTEILTEASGNGEVIKGLRLQDTRTGDEETLMTTLAVLAPGHSARDTFFMLHRHHVVMTPKAFAVGVRMEHPQKLVNKAQYGEGYPEMLPAAPYKLTVNLSNGRGVYTFCMCPGGYVVNASSEENRLAVNGMSYSGRSGKNANSAVIVTVSPEDYKAYENGEEDPLSGVVFQRELEEAAYRAGKGCVPVQRFGDFRNHMPSEGPGSIIPQIKGAYRWTDVRSIFPETIADALEEGILAFDEKIPGYADEDAVMSAVESRTSSPLRILRDEAFESSIRGLYPCGEGAGYAGGITSAATDGLKVAEAVSRIYRPFDRDSQS